MTNRSKQKGTSAETAVTEYLRSCGFNAAERRALSGAMDKGDISLHPDIVIEVKNHKQMKLSEWLDELITEIANAQAATGGVWHKRPRKGSPADWYVTMPGYLYVGILKILIAHAKG